MTAGVAVVDGARITWGWPAHQHMLWPVMSTTVALGSPSIDWDVAVERANQAQWITVKKLTSEALTFEGVLS